MSSAIVFIYLFFIIGVNISLTCFTEVVFGYAVRKFVIIKRIWLFIFGKATVGVFIAIVRALLFVTKGIGFYFEKLSMRIIVEFELVQFVILLAKLGTGFAHYFVKWIAEIIEFLIGLGFFFMIAGNFVRLLGD